MYSKFSLLLVVISVFVSVTFCTKTKDCEPCFQFQDPDFGYAKFCVGDPETQTLDDLKALEHKIKSQKIEVEEAERCK